MNLRLSTYFTVVLVAGTVFVFQMDARLGFAYGLAALGVIAPLYLFPVPRRFFYAVLFSAGSLWLSYLVRPLFAIPMPELFTFPRLGALDDHLIFKVLLKTGIYSSALMCGLIAGIRLFQSREQEASADTDREPFLIRNITVISILLMIFFLLRAVLLLRFGVGIKGVPLSSEGRSVAFLIQLIPESLIYAVLALYVISYRHQITTFQRRYFYFILAGFSILVLLTGSKAFIFRIALAVFILVLAQWGNFTLRLRHAFGFLALFIVVYALSWSIGPAVKHYNKQGGLDARALTIGVEAARLMVDEPEVGAFVAAEGTSRFVGFDGLAATELAEVPEVQDVFSLPSTLKRIVFMLVPLAGTDIVTSGYALSVHYLGLDPDVQNAGAIGLFGALQLAMGKLALFGVLAIGLFWGGAFGAAERARSADLTFLIHYIIAYSVLRWSMSGNFDLIVSAMIMHVVQLVAYVGIVAVVEAAVTYERSRVEVAKT